jgi:hypothetical protein
VTPDEPLEPSEPFDDRAACRLLCPEAFRVVTAALHSKDPQIRAQALRQYGYRIEAIQLSPYAVLRFPDD